MLDHCHICLPASVLDVSPYSALLFVIHTLSLGSLSLVGTHCVCHRVYRWFPSFVVPSGVFVMWILFFVGRGEFLYGL